MGIEGFPKRNESVEREKPTRILTLQYETDGPHWETIALLEIPQDFNLEQAKAEFEKQSGYDRWEREFEYQSRTDHLNDFKEWLLKTGKAKEVQNEHLRDSEM